MVQKSLLEEYWRPLLLRLQKGPARTRARQVTLLLRDFSRVRLCATL